MKRHILLSLLFTTLCFSQVKNSGGFLTADSPATMLPSAILEARSTTKGVLFPRMTTTQRNAILSPAIGLLIFNTTTGLFNFYNGSWVNLSTSSTPTLQQVLDNNHDLSNSRFYAGTGAGIGNTFDNVTLFGENAAATNDNQAVFAVSTGGNFVLQYNNHKMTTPTVDGTPIYSVNETIQPNTNGNINMGFADVLAKLGRGFNGGDFLGLTNIDLDYSYKNQFLAFSNETMDGNITLTIKKPEFISGNYYEGIEYIVSNTSDYQIEFIPDTDVVLDADLLIIPKNSTAHIKLIEATFSGYNIGHFIISYEFSTLPTALGTVTNVTATSPIHVTGTTTVTPNIEVDKAAADNTTFGVATFNPSDFNSSVGAISLDIVNGQSASASQKGFLTSTDWTIFNTKISANTAITGATKTKITYDSKGLVTSGADATTADIADTTNKRYQTDTQQTNNDATSSIQTQLNNKQATLVSATNIKTVNGTTLLGSGDLSTTQTTVSGNAGTATALQTARTIGIITGDATSIGSTFDGSANNTNSITVTKINGTSLAGLATGILKNTTTTGVPSIAVAADFPTLNQNTTGNAATVTTNANLTGVITSSGNATSIASQTGTGTKFVVDNSPTLITPNIGVATGTSLVATGSIFAGATASLSINGRSSISSSAADIINLFDSAGSSAPRLVFGSTNSSFPAIKKSGTGLAAVLGNDSGFTSIQTLYDRFGSGSPESVITAPVGCVYHRTDGSSGTSLYVKESGTGNTGWVAK